jgi:hypothetical protein
MNSNFKFYFNDSEGEKQEHRDFKEIKLYAQSEANKTAKNVIIYNIGNEILETIKPIEKQRDIEPDISNGVILVQATKANVFPGDYVYSKRDATNRFKVTYVFLNPAGDSFNCVLQSVEKPFNERAYKLIDFLAIVNGGK